MLLNNVLGNISAQVCHCDFAVHVKPLPKALPQKRHHNSVAHQQSGINWLQI